MTEARRDIIYSLVGAAMLLALPFVLRAANAVGLIEDSGGVVAKRVLGVTVGLFLALYGNVIPKRLGRYNPDSARPACRQAVLRYCGWVFVLAGLANALIWLVAPIASAASWSKVPVVAALALVALRIARAKQGSRA